MPEERSPLPRLPECLPANPFGDVPAAVWQDTPHSIAPIRDQLRAAVQRIWGYPDLRSPQGEIAEALLGGYDAIAVVPTGGGKSIAFQLPALLQTGLTIVVSPLVALMENQVAALQRRKLPAALIHSELGRSPRRETLAAVAANRLRLLYVSPETLLSEAVWAVLTQPQVDIRGLMLDEAHCLTQWGDTFRPEYRRLGAVRPALLRGKPAGTRIAIAAFTATADPATQRDIVRTLGLHRPQTVVLSPYRDNLHVAVQTVWSPRNRRERVGRLAQAGGCGLVYARTRRDTETLAAWLGDRGVASAAYHAGLAGAERRRIEDQWLSGAIPVVVCTSAFGMGVDKPDVRWVVHFHPPLLLAEYLQEIGRAGRDRQPARAIALVSEPTGWLDPSDRQRQQSFLDRQRDLYRRAAALVPRLPERGSLIEVTGQHRDGAIALSLLQAAGQLRWLDPFHYQIQPPARIAPPDATAVQTLRRYWRTRDCRWRFVRVAFGDRNVAADWRCGHCDRCRSVR